MAIIVADNHFLQASSTRINDSRFQRMTKQFKNVLFNRIKHNRSPYPDRVWQRHSALLNAARAKR